LHFWRKDIAEEAQAFLKKSFTNFAQVALEENASLKAEEEKLKMLDEEAKVKVADPPEAKEGEKNDNKDAFLFLSLNNA
jgi:hypothetical protein